MAATGDKFTKQTTAQEAVDTLADNIKGRYIVVTGPSPGGIGYETARAIATKEPKLLVLAARSQAKLDQAKADILKETPNANVETVILDLDSLASVRQAAKEISAKGQLDVLINNAAVMMTPYGKTSDGFETQFGTNYIAPWLLTNLLLPNLLKSAHPRVVFVSSMGHQFGDIRWDDIDYSKGDYDKTNSYGQSKTASILNAKYLAKKFGSQGLTAVALHPGAIPTNLGRHLEEGDIAALSSFFNEDGTPNMSLGFWKSIPEGATTTITAAFDPRWEKQNGAYLVNSQVAPLQKAGEEIPYGTENILALWADDDKSAERLWELTNKLTNENF
ncbi:hypothetical protein VHUM_01721 [Vanrija humicola]|uniref:Uncharacterized protein n=1 Tax=Vanrija humicola TaxID=5417 RepID=A0A7D8V0T4_VANHU|nr:hypothetical protein VHUM_01721 [Vanrija humicola]